LETVFKNRVTDRVNGSYPVTRFQCWCRTFVVPSLHLSSGAGQRLKWKNRGGGTVDSGWPLFVVVGLAAVVTGSHVRPIVFAVM